jgi:hypothetical protein
MIRLVFFGFLGCQKTGLYDYCCSNIEWICLSLEVFAVSGQVLHFVDQKSIYTVGVGFDKNQLID